MYIAGPNGLPDNDAMPRNWHGRADTVGPCSVITGGDNTSAPSLFGVGANDERNILIKAVMKGFNRRKKGIEITMNDDTGADIALSTGTFHHMVTILPRVFELDVEIQFNQGVCARIDGFVHRQSMIRMQHQRPTTNVSAGFLERRWGIDPSALQPVRGQLYQLSGPGVQARAFVVLQNIG